ncbi:MAG: hypothetical protein ACKV2T_35900 [Kofleriaceae bacterium]
MSEPSMPSADSPGRALVTALLAAEAVELTSDGREEVVQAIDRVLAGEPKPERRTKQVHEALMNHDAVEEVFLDEKELRQLIIRVC